MRRHGSETLSVDLGGQRLRAGRALLELGSASAADLAERGVGAGVVSGSSGVRRGRAGQGSAGPRPGCRGRAAGGHVSCLSVGLCGRVDVRVVGEVGPGRVGLLRVARLVGDRLLRCGRHALRGTRAGQFPCPTRWPHDQPTERASDTTALDPGRRDMTRHRREAVLERAPTTTPARETFLSRSVFSTRGRLMPDCSGCGRWFAAVGQGRPAADPLRLLSHEPRQDRRAGLARDPSSRSRRAAGVRRRGVRRPSTEVDHITPLALGGEPLARWNLQGMCKRHNASKGARVRPAAPARTPRRWQL